MISPTKTYHIAMILDDWFPHTGRKTGKFGGTQVHVRELKKNLELKHNCQVVLFYQSHQNFLIQVLWPLIALVDVLLYNRYHRLDLIHVHGFWSALTAKLLSIILKIPVVQTVHTLPVSWLGKIIFTRVAYTYQITVSNIFTQFRNVNSNLKVIPNGVNLTDFNSVQVKKLSHPTLIWVGNDDPSKGLDYLKKAILKVRKIYPDFKANLVTSGRLSGRELIKAYKRSNVFALSSLIESQPITLLEAWAARLPVVVTNVGDNGLMVKHNQTGILVEPGNTKQLAEAVIKLIKYKNKAVKMGEKGYQYVKENYSWTKVAKETFSVYRYSLQNYHNLTNTTKAKVLLTSRAFIDR